MQPNLVERAWLDDLFDAAREAVGLIRFLVLVLIERRN